MAAEDTEDPMQALYIIYEIVSMLTNVLVMLIIIQFIIGLLFAFNVICLLYTSPSPRDS